MARPKKDIRLFVFNRDNHKCVQCKVELFINPKSKGNFLVNGNYHHLIPLCYKGEDKEDNLCILCIKCHLKVHSGEEIKEKYFTMFNNFKKTGRLF